MRDPISLSPIPQRLNVDLPEDIMYQPDIIGGSHGFPARTRDDFWDSLGAEADAVPTAPHGTNTRQRLNDFSVVAGILSKQALQFNSARTYFAIQNRGVASIFIAFGKPATLKSFEIPPGPGFYEPILGTVSSVHVISAVADIPVTVVEGFRVS